MTENESKLIDAIMRYRFSCPLKDDADINYEKECVGYREHGCRECILRHIEELD